jgi:NAD(P)-dependent dehydrogenase (short-subunit alcohol dehydrogenase family)
MTDSIFDLTGRTALITGGGTGLGKHFAEVLSGAGAVVILCARRVDKLQQTVDEINSGGGQAYCYVMDVTSEASITEAFDQAAAHGTVDILVNNAGTVAQPSLLELDEATWDSVQATNLKGAWMVAKEAVTRMVDKETSGSVINIASILGIAVQKGTGPYSASKAALLHLTENMAVEWARYGVRVNSIAPGYYATDLAEEYLESPQGQAMLRGIPQRRLGNDEYMSGKI